MGNVEVMKGLAALGADVTLPDGCKEHVRLASNPVKDETSTQPAYDTMCIEEELYVRSLATGVHEACDSGRFDSVPLNESKPPDIAALLEEIGAFNTSRSTDSIHGQGGRHSVGASDHESPPLMNESASQAAASIAQPLTDPAAPFLSLIPDGDVTPDQAVKALKRLQACKSERQKRGVRVLCLDGGGVRGLVELEILRQIEETLGGEITELFDYIAATSTGGIITLGMVYGKWSYQNTITTALTNNSVYNYLLQHGLSVMTYTL